MDAPRCIVIFLYILRPGSASALARDGRTAFVEGDLLIGGLFPVHDQPRQSEASRTLCGEVNGHRGIQYVEAAFYAIDQINRNPEILPNITLGIEMRDTCWNSPMALDQTIEFIRGAIVDRSQNESSGYMDHDKRFVGIIGPVSSEVTIDVQNLVQVFKIPQISYATTTSDLSDKSRFPYFLRMVPPNYYQAQAIVDLADYYGWTYVFTINSDTNYGQNGIAAFKNLARKKNICVAQEKEILQNAKEEEVDKIITELSTDQRITVLVCFCEGKTVRNLLLSLKKFGMTNRFLFIGSEAWADKNIVSGLEDVAAGSFFIKIHSSHYSAFDEYYFKLNPANNKRNPWFAEYWQYKFNCSLEPEANMSHRQKVCTGEEDLRKGYTQDQKLPFVVKSIYAMAYALHSLQKELCKSEESLCEQMISNNRPLLLKHLMNLTFSLMNDTIHFDSNGDGVPNYDILNFQYSQNRSIDEYVCVGSWSDGSLQMFGGANFGLPGHSRPLSVCSKPCEIGEVKTFPEDGPLGNKCCWTCHQCQQNEFVKNETICDACGEDFRPNNDFSGCSLIPVEYLDWSTGISIAALSLAVVGFLLTLSTMGVFWKYRETPAVKSSSIELSYWILIGMILSYCSSLTLLCMPSRSSCLLSRVLPGISLSMVFGGMITKTDRIGRIVFSANKYRMAKYVSGPAQLVIAGSIVFIELVIVLVLLVVQPAETAHAYPQIGQVVLICNTTTIDDVGPLIFVFFLIIFCALSAVRARNVPKRFNEAKWIGYVTYIVIFLWIAWTPLYMRTGSSELILSLFISLNSLVALALLFGPKFNIVLFRPDKNTREYFKTNFGISSHLGGPSATSDLTLENVSPRGQLETSVIWSTASSFPHMSERKNLSVNVSVDTEIELTNDQKELLNLGANCHFQSKWSPLTKSIELEMLYTDLCRLESEGKVRMNHNLKTLMMAEAVKKRTSAKGDLLSQKLKQAAKELKQHSEIIVRKADKSNLLVLM